MKQATNIGPSIAMVKVMSGGSLADALVMPRERFECEGGPVLWRFVGRLRRRGILAAIVPSC